MTRMMGPPIRFVAMIITLWTGLRLVTGEPVSPVPIQQDIAAEPAGKPTTANATHGTRPKPSAPLTLPRPFFAPVSRGFAEQPRAPFALAYRLPDTVRYNPAPSPALDSQPVLPAAVSRSAVRDTHGRPSRASFSLWAQWRADPDIAALASGAELGGSQAGLRARLPFWRVAGVPLAANARLSRPIRRQYGTEAGLGLTVRPVDAVPLNVTIERRIALDTGGRNAWALGLDGGLYRQAIGLGFELDGYAQAGIVGANRRDLYVDGAAIISRSFPIIDGVELSAGAGSWGGAQPGAARLDIGPETSLRFRLGDAGIRWSLSWRNRVAGNAAPGSGPVLSLGADF